MRYEWELTLGSVQREQTELNSRIAELEDIITTKDGSNARLARELALMQQKHTNSESDLQIYEKKVNKAIKTLQERVGRETMTGQLMREKSTELQLVVDRLQEQCSRHEQRYKCMEEKLTNISSLKGVIEQKLKEREDEAECLRQEITALIAEHVKMIQRVQREAKKEVERERESKELVVCELEEMRKRNDTLVVEVQKRADLLEAIDSRLDSLHVE